MTYVQETSSKEIGKLESQYTAIELIEAVDYVNCIAYVVTAFNYAFAGVNVNATFVRPTYTTVKITIFNEKKSIVKKLICN